MRLQDIYKESVFAVQKEMDMKIIIPKLGIKNGDDFLNNTLVFYIENDIPNITMIGELDYFEKLDDIYESFCHELMHGVQNQLNLVKKVNTFNFLGNTYHKDLESVKEYLINEGICNYVSYLICESKGWQNTEPRFAINETYAADYLKNVEKLKKGVDNMPERAKYSFNYKEMGPFLGNLKSLLLLGQKMYDQGFHYVKQFHEESGYPIRKTVMRVRDEFKDEVLKGL
ncbi:hypothetical protein ACFL1H_06665 [Nanoarchaeota archaeon]